MKWKDWDINIKVRLIGELFLSMLFWMYFPFMALYFTDSFGNKITGFLMIIPPILGVVANLFGGYAADRFGRKRMMVIASFSQSICLFAFAFSPSPWLDFLVFTCMTFMGSFYHPAAMAMVADVATPEQRKSIFAAFYASMNLGVVFGPFLGSIFFFEYRFWLLLICATAEFIFCMVMIRVVRETLPASLEVKPRGNIILEQIKNYRLILTDKVFLLYTVAGILVSQAYMQMDLYLGVYLKNYVQVQSFISIGDWNYMIDGVKLFGWMIAENGLMVVLFALLIAHLTRQWSDQFVLSFTAILFGLSLWLMAFTKNAWLLLGCMFIFTLAELIRTPVQQNFIAKLAPEDQRGQYMGASSLQYSIGRSIAPLSITLAAWLEPFEVFSLMLIAGILSALFNNWMFHVLERRIEQNSMQRIEATEL